MKTHYFAPIFKGILFALCLSSRWALAEAKRQGKHGFKIVNKTQFPIQVSIGQVGPLYWGVVQPGQTFHRRTGAVWFTLSAETYIEGTTRKIKKSDAIIPIATMVATSLSAAFTLGTSAVAAGAAGGATAVAAGTLGSSVVGVSSALVAAGIPATSALAVGGALVGGTMSQAVVGPVMRKIFSKENVMASKKGCYARRCPTYEVTGGPKFEKTKVDGKDVANLVGSPMRMRKV